MAAEEEAAKLRRHLSLLREEYVKLQSRYVDLERRYHIATASTASLSPSHPSQAPSPNQSLPSNSFGSSASNVSSASDHSSFVSRLLKTVADLFDKELYSDMTVILDGTHLCAHRFVLAARSDHWGVPSLGEVDQLDMSDVAQDVAFALLKWVYTDNVDLGANEAFLLDLMKAASVYKLIPLIQRCESMLMTTVNVRNCIKFYTVADSIETVALKNHCSELISNHWDDFTVMDFAHMSAPLLYNMFKAKSLHPLHTAIRMRREDVVFLFLMEFDSQLATKLNEVDLKGDLALDLALRDKQEGVAQTLVSHSIDVNARDNTGRTLLHKAVERGDEFAASFLINHRSSVNCVVPVDLSTPLHLVANLKAKVSVSNGLDGMTHVAHLLLEHGADPNVRDAFGNTPLHVAIAARNRDVFAVILEQKTLNMEALNEKGETVLWLALEALQHDGIRDFAEALIARDASPDAVNKDTGDAILHRSIRCNYEEAALFLCDHGALVNHANKKGESSLHVACEKGLVRVTETLLRKGANANYQTSFLKSGNAEVFKQTPLHIAIRNGHKECIDAIITHKEYAQHSQEHTLIIPNFNLSDSDDQTPLGLALLMGHLSIARKLLSGEASVNVRNRDGLSILHQAILFQETPSALFLLENGADYTLKTGDGKTPLQLAIESHLPRVVEALCELRVGLDTGGSVADPPPLWSALDSGQEEIASVLVRYKCDTNCWGPGPDGCEQTLLHRAIDENNECVACFLIRSGCDVDAPRRPSASGQGGDEAFDLQSPLHLACAWGLEAIVQTLLEHSANVNAQDVDGKTPLHVAIVNQHPSIISLLLGFTGLDLSVRDKQGQTTFAVAMITKNNKAAQAILKRQPTAAEQYNNKGLNFLHTAIQKCDVESVLFLLSINVNVHSRVQDHTQLTPLHLTVLSGSEILVRNLLLAGANVNDVTPQKQTVLHLAASKDHSTISTVLLENGVLYDAVDGNQNNALHIAVQNGHLATIKVLLTESRINAEAVNLRGQNPMHILCQRGKESAAAIFEFFTECMPEYPVNKPDAEGHTPLLLAYMNGNGALCRAIVRFGACLGTVNRHGISIFNHQVATKQLLYRLLDLLTKEPPWSEGDACLECGAKFGIATRRHHCRHCGRLLCSKCSSREMPILKYNLNKPVRVCEICFDVLTLGSS